VKRIIISVVAALTALALVGISSIPTASAHETRTVAGKYKFVVGFLNEPALLEEPNGIDLRISNAQTNDPVEGLEKTLKADIIVGGQTKTTDLRARFGMKGAYTADIIPTKTGTWSFRFYGTVEGAQVDEKFESGPGRFGDVEAKSNIQFPNQEPSIAELAQQGGRPSDAGAQPVTASPDVQKALDRADSAKNTAIGFGVVGIVIGLAGVGLAWYALRSRSGAAGGNGSGGRPEPV
jgi:hypothetical protein